MNKLIIGLPSKGRLQRDTSDFFARSGLNIQKCGGARGYKGMITGIETVEIFFLSASEIARDLMAGSLHLGVTGLDLVQETAGQSTGCFVFVAPLGFGYANVVVAVPGFWIDVDCMADIDDVASAFYARHRKRMRVATKYIHLARNFFAAHGIMDYRLVESHGATEGGPASDAAELIVDISTTGTTLEANGLKTLEDGLILRSQAYLVASCSADWGKQVRSALATILGRISAETAARDLREVSFRFMEGRDALVKETIQRFGCTLPFGGGRDITVLHCPEQNVYALVAMLRESFESGTIRIARLDKIFAKDDLLFREMAQRMGWSDLYPESGL
ncbi:MAG: ATP phosphoribosyltransferase [Alphaproteobacteria bacterium]|nr:ATP phosphoribosyltransferase [Alphaproteobacteria bacterium]